MSAQKNLPTQGTLLLLALAYCVFLTTCNIFGNFVFPDCDHPTKCFDLRSELRGSLDPTADPCDDLYDHVCADFTFAHPLADQLTLLRRRTDVTLLNVLLKPHDAQSTSALDKVAVAFQNCVRVRSNREEHTDVVKALLQRYNFKWPALEQDKDFDYLDLSVGLALDYGIHFLFSMTTFPYLPTDRKYTLAISWLRGFIRPPNSLEQSRNASDIVNCIRVFSSRPEEELQKMADIITDVHYDVMALSSSDRFVVGGNYTAFSDIKSVSPTITTAEWITAINKHLPSEGGITASDQLLVVSAGLLLLQNVLPAYKETMGRLMLFCGYALAVNLAHTFSYNQMECTVPFKPKLGVEFTGLCISTVSGLAPFAVARLLFDEILDPSNVKFAAQMYGEIRRETEKSFSNLSWMVTADTRKAAVDRVASIVDVEGLPKGLSTNKEIEDYYAYLPLFNRSFIEDYLEASRLKMLQVKARLKVNATDSPVRRDHTDMDMTEVNAYYVPVLHMLVIPGGVLQPPFVSTADPVPASYGAIGRVMGHEMSHPFDPLLGVTSRTGGRCCLGGPLAGQKLSPGVVCRHRGAGKSDPRVQESFQGLGFDAGLHAGRAVFRCLLFHLLQLEQD